MHPHMLLTCPALLAGEPQNVDVRAGQVRRCCDVVRDGNQGEELFPPLLLALHHHRRGAPHQEREQPAVNGRSPAAHKLPVAHYG
eukprot:121150-Chlamydomonas_euryale.AAC.1